MRLERIRDRQDPRVERSLAEYRTSFPLHEQRRAPSQAALFEREAYHFTLLLDGDQEVGTLLYWDLGDALYVEHFYIYARFRGQSYGTAALKELTGSGRTVILEIDPPEDPVSVRRQAFYRRCGFVENPFPHVHPPYRPGQTGHRLVVLSYPAPLTRAAYDAFGAALRDQVMAGALD